MSRASFWFRLVFTTRWSLVWAVVLVAMVLCLVFG